MDTISRANQAQRLLNDEVLQQAFEDLQTETIRELLATPENAPDRRESLYRNVKAIERIKTKLQSYADDGKFAAARAERETRA